MVLVLKFLLLGLLLYFLPVVRSKNFNGPLQYDLDLLTKQRNDFVNAIENLKQVNPRFPNSTIDDYIGVIGQNPVE